MYKRELTIMSLPESTGLTMDEVITWSKCKFDAFFKGKHSQRVFLEFLRLSLAEENLMFHQEVEALSSLKTKKGRKKKAKAIMKEYEQSLNVAQTLMKEMKASAELSDPDLEPFERAQKQVLHMLEGDHFPRFQRSEFYIEFLEQLLDESEVKSWSTSFDTLLKNPAGRDRFRKFLQRTYADENLQFWEAVYRYKTLSYQVQDRIGVANQIYETFLGNGSPSEVHIPSTIRDSIEKALAEMGQESRDEQSLANDETIFDEAQLYVEQVLKNDPFVRFLESTEYKSLLQGIREKAEYDD